LIRECYSRAGLDPIDTTFIEAYGTGTKAGDPIDANAISAGMNGDRPADKPLLLHPVKTNIGHTEGSSGIAAVIETALSLEHKMVAPGINFEKPNPEIDLETQKLFVSCPSFECFVRQMKAPVDK